tara:strand:+ start:12695 stop:14197 length:1503 start_codon:yes stop_codon:yes gene_type:complete
MKIGVTATAIVFFLLVLVAIFTSRLVAFPSVPIGNVDDDMVTVIIPTFNRDVANVTKIIHYYLDNQIVKDVFLVQFETGNDVPITPSPILNRKWIKYLYKNDLRNRFNPVVDVTSPYVLITDDDVLIKKNYLNGLVKAAGAETHLFHGIDGRNLIYNKNQKVFKYKCSSPPLMKISQKVDILLTSCLLSYAPTIKRAFSIYELKNKYFAERFNGEDIVLCLSHGLKKCRLWNWGKVAWNAHEFPHYPGKKNIRSDNTIELSKNKLHAHNRSKITNSLVKNILTRRLIYIYFHVRATGKWKDEVYEIFKALKKLRVFEIIKELRVCVLGEDVTVLSDLWNFDPKIKIRATSRDTTSSQSFTLNILQKDSKTGSFYAFYMHNVENLIPKKWVRLVINECWKDHIKLLFDMQAHDVAGALLSNYSLGAHFCVNFWWSKSEFLKNKNYVASHDDDLVHKWILSSEGCTALNLKKVNLKLLPTQPVGSYNVVSHDNALFIANPGP